MKKPLALLLALCWFTTAASATQTLHPIADAQDVGKSGRAWLVKAPGSGEGAMQQLDAVSPAIVGDGKEDQGWGYLLAFAVDEATAQAIAAPGATLSLRVKTARVIGRGAHAPIRLHLLSTRQAPNRWSMFGAVNKAPDLATHTQTIPGDAGEQEVTFDLTALLAKSPGVEPGKLLYLMLACDPITDGDGVGGHLEFVAEGDDRPALIITPAAN